MSKKLPAFQFYTGDWLKDPSLGMCSPATRGVWIDLMCVMHERNRSGLITGTREQIARICRCTAVEFDAAITELQTTSAADVTERNGVVTVTCRRMKREADERKAAAERKRRERSRNKADPAPDNVTQKSRSYSSSSVSTSDCSNEQSSDGVTKVPPDEVDWLTVESDFIDCWNKLDGVARLSVKALPGNVISLFRESYLTPGWLERAHEAMAKFPLNNGVRMGIRKFLQPTTVDEILGGVHDWKSNDKQDKASKHAGAGSVYDGTTGGKF